jgi:Protein of unknown function (DUF1592)/Protein of unknown function (DUF1588)/Protein of unknown function (DUF1595)/Protein of unknown function (DUF1585)/Protein of unknown function (DUF1587)
MRAPAPSAAPPQAPDDPITPRRLWRLPNAAIDEVLADLLGVRLHVTKGFLPEKRDEGYDNDVVALGVSDSKIDELATAAERAAAYVSKPDNLARLAPCPTGELEVCARTFVAGFATRAWGRAPDADELAGLWGVFAAGQASDGYPGGIGLVVEAVLQSPHFIYRSELGGELIRPGVARLTELEIASALSFLFRGARPDAPLIEAAAGGHLFSPDGREREARRLLALPETRRHLARFLRAWLGLRDIHFLNKDTGHYPMFTPIVRQAMDRELTLFLDHVLAEGGKLDALFLADYTFASPALLPIYGEDLLAPPGEFTRVPLAPHRRGILTSPALLAAHGNIDQSNPILRGLMVRGRFFCQDLPPPPPAFAIQPPPRNDAVTTRERYAAHSNDPRCIPCHQAIDPPGFGFENFDTIGRHRTTENGRAIDATGSLSNTDVDGAFTGPAELATRLMGSAQFHRCFTQQLLRFAEGRAIEGGDRADIDALAAAFARAGHDIDELLVALVRRPNFVLRKVAEATP